MNLREAIDVVLNEAESSAVRENNQETMNVVYKLSYIFNFIA